MCSCFFKYTAIFQTLYIDIHAFIFIYSSICKSYMNTHTYIYKYKTCIHINIGKYVYEYIYMNTYIYMSTYDYKWVCLKIHEIGK
jgi:hypothetical protein